MAVFLPDLNALFVHIPKTGGTWVEQALEASGLRCEPARGPGRHGLRMAYDHPGAKSFCFVRRPFDWYGSIWRGLQSGWPARRDIAPLHKERTWSPVRMLTYLAGAKSFAEFMSTVHLEQPGFCSRMFEWYIGPPGYPLVDYVGRQEHLADDLEVILNQLGWDGELAEVDPVNVGDRLETDARFMGHREVADSRWYEDGFRGPGPFKVMAE